MHFEKQNAFRNESKLIFFQKKRTIKKYMCAYPTLPKNFTPLTRNTLIFLFGVSEILFLKIQQMTTKP